MLGKGSKMPGLCTVVRELPATYIITMKKKRGGCSTVKPGIKRQILNEFYSSIPEDHQDIKRGHVIRLFFEKDSSVAATICALLDVIPPSAVVECNDVKPLINKFDFFKNLSRPTEKEKFMDFLSGSFSFRLQVAEKPVASPQPSDLASTCGSLANKSEDEVLAAIKRLAGCEENTMVARLTLYNMRQDHDETVHGFGARLRGQAGICKFIVKCPGCEADVSYTEAMMRDVLTRGVADPEIKLDLLGNKNQDMTLEEVLQFIEAKEAVTRCSLKPPPVGLNFQQRTPEVKLLENTYCVVDIKEGTEREMVLIDIKEESDEEIFVEEEAEMSDKEESDEEILDDDEYPSESKSRYLNGAEGSSSILKGAGQDLTNMESSSHKSTGFDGCMKDDMVHIAVETEREILDKEDPTTDSNLVAIPSLEFSSANLKDVSQDVTNRESSSDTECDHTHDQDSGGKQGHVCTKCHKSFTIESDLSLHVNGGCGEVSDQCPVCQKIFKSKHYLSLHMRVHNGEKPYKCPECGVRFTWKHNFNSHMRIHTGERPFKCLECGKGFPDNKSLKVHFRRHTGSEPYQCSYCNMKLNSKADFMRHERTHTGEKPYPCSVCDKRFARKGDRMRHEKRAHKETNSKEKQHSSSGENKAALPRDLDGQRSYINTIWYQCPECETKFKSKPSFMLHMKEHAGDYQCSECEKQFMSKTGLIGHKRIHEGEKLLQCSECEQILSSKQHLENHKRMHTGERPFECLLCDMKFTAKSSLKEHIRKHTRDNPHKCCYCNRNFSTKGDLTRHSRIHTGEKPFQCDACKRRFSRHNDLKKHVQKAQAISEEPHSCTECNEKFCLKVDLKKHIRTHIETMPHKCSNCVQKFFTLSELETHIKNIHGVKGSCTCLVCKETFSTENYLMIHMKFHAVEKPYQCSKCEKRFHLKESLFTHMKRHTRAKHGLKSHMTMHTGSGSYPCTECHVKCRSKASLTRHIRTHTGEKPHQCCKCGKQFVRQSDLVKHEKSHAEDTKTYLCFICGKTFDQKNNFNGHMGSHTRATSGVRPYQCLECNTAFTKQLYLTKHMNRQHRGGPVFSSKDSPKTQDSSKTSIDGIGCPAGEKLFQCSECLKYFIRRSGLTRHMKMHIGIKPSQSS